MLTDNPIETASEDLLKRGKMAKSIADSLRIVDASKGYVFGVLGPWGSGKTSLINLVREQLERAPAVTVLDFNPWMFSGTEQLMETFFNELAGQLRLKGDRFAAIAEALDSYSQLLTPFEKVPWLGPWVGRVRGFLAYMRTVSSQRKGTIHTRRATLEKKLRELDWPIVVVIDDLDRLTSAETREIFKLVRLTANFPKIIYLVAFDRRRVESALTGDGSVGRDYLEKIMQATVDIPKVPEQLLLSTFGTFVSRAIEATGAEIRLDDSRWPDVMFDVVWPLVNNMRDVRRFASSIDATLRELQDEVELADVLALEAVRVFMPDTFAEVHRSQAFLTSHESSPPGEAAIRELLTVAETEGRRPVAQALVERLFPAAAHYVGGQNFDSSWVHQWRRGRRVADTEILRRYLERVVGDTMQAFVTAELLYEVIEDGTALANALDAIEPATLSDTIAALEAYEHEYPIAAVVPAAVALLNKMPDIPERPRTMFDLIDTRLVVTRVVLRLLRRLDSADEVLRAVRDALPQIGPLASRRDLISLVGYQEGAGFKLIPEDDAKALEQELSGLVIETPPDRLAAERDLLRLLYWAKKSGADVPAYLRENPMPALSRAVLSAAASYRRTRSFGSRSEERTLVLFWDALVTVFGSEEAVREAVHRARSAGPDDEETVAALALADRYLDGWRPTPFPGDSD